MSIIKGTNQIVAGFGGTKRSIGEVYFSQSSLATDNSGALPLFTGETIASANTIYPDFYKWVLAHTELQCTSAEYESALSTYGECPKYVVSSGSLRLPKLSNYIKVANTAEGITQKEAGLPNITGEIGSFVAPYPMKGAFTSAFSANTGQGGSGQVRKAIMDASRSSPVYGKSDTVTPAHTTLYPWVVAYTAAIPASEAQAAEFQQGLTGKADTNLGNVASNLDYVVESYYGEDGNWYRVYKSGWVEQGGYMNTGGVVTFLKPFASDTNYTIVFGNNTLTNYSGTIPLNQMGFKARSATGFTATADANHQKHWNACGMGAN